MVDEVHVTEGLRSTGVISDRGSYYISTHNYPMSHDDGWRWEAYTRRSGAAVSLRRLWFFDWGNDGGAWGAPLLYVVVPHWVVPAVSGPLPAVRVCRWLRRRRLARRRGFDVEPATQAS